MRRALVLLSITLSSFLLASCGSETSAIPVTLGSLIIASCENNSTCEASSARDNRSDTTAPIAPSSLTASVSSGTVNLSWNSVAGANYKVYQEVYQSTGTPFSNDLSSYTTYNVSTTSTEITGLINGTSYYFMVTALENGKESPASNVVIGLPDFPIPPEPTSLTVTSVSSGTVNLSWNSVAGATYKVYQSTGSIDDDLSNYTSYNVTTTSTEITDLTNGTTYSFVVTALANGKESLASEWVSGFPDFPIPPAPTSLTVTSESSGTVNLSWNSVAGATYKVYQSTASIADDLSSYQSYEAITSSTEITGLRNGTSYYFVVTALANGKESLASDEVSGFPDFSIPPAPTSLTVTSESSGTVNLSWNSIAGASYKVYQSTTGSIGGDLSSYTSYNVSTSSTEITGLTNNTSYYFVVTALANGKESPASGEIIGLPDFPIPSVPTSLEATASSGTVNLSWNSVAGATYKVYQSTGLIDDDLSSYTSYNVTTSSIEITDLTNGTTYSFVVTALANGKESLASEWVSGFPDFPIPPAPTSLTVTSESSGTVNLSWNSVAGASYRVQQYNDLSGLVLYDITTSSIEITDLTNGTTYYFVVTALANGKESLVSNRVSGFPDFPIPPVPTSLTVTSVNGGVVNLSWTGSAGAYYYKVYQSTATIGDDLSGSIFRNATTNSIEITGLTNGRTYYFVVTALANGKESPASNEIDGRPDFPIPSTPTSLTVTSESSGTVNLSWNGVAGASYRVYQSTATIGDDLSSYTTYNVSTSSTGITELTNGTRYYFVVTALANGKESPASNEVIGNPDFPIPATPTSLTVTSESSGTVNLSWTGSAGAYYYKVYQSTATIGDDLSSYTSYTVTTTSTEIPDLTNGTRYYFVVTALANGKESSTSGEVDGLPDFPIPLVPTSLTVTNESSGTVNLNWNSVAGASYKVYQSTGSIGDDLSGYTSYNTSATSRLVTDLANGTRYYFVVTALANGKESPASNVAIGLPDFPIPPAPTSLTVTNESSGTVYLSWNSVAGATRYQVYRSTGPIIGDNSELYTYTVTSVNILGLKNGTIYSFVVTALVNGKESPVSNGVIGRPDYPIPQAPTNLRSSVSSGTVNLNWNRVAGASYKVHQAEDSFGGVIADNYENLRGYISYNVSAISTAITGLMNGTRYFFVVTARANGKESLASNGVDELPDFPIPSSPTNLTVTSASSGTVSLSWSSVVGVSYRVHQAKEDSFRGHVVADYEASVAGYTTYNVTESSIDIPGLTNGTLYSFVVTALANGKESPASDEIIGLPDFPIPSTPTNLRATLSSGTSSGTVILSWDNVVGATYKVYQSTGVIANDLSSYTSYTVTTSSITITELTNNTTYHFVVTALANGKESPASTGVTGVPEFPVPSPTSLVVTPSSQAVSLRWTGSDIVSSYEVHQAENSFNGVNDYNQLPGYTLYNTTATSKVVTGLVNGMTYYFVVTALLANGRESSASNEASATTDESLIQPPMNLMATANVRTINLNWTDSGNEAAGYRVHQAIQTFSDISPNNYNTLDGYQLHEVTSTSISITGLVRERYYFVVTAFKSATRESLASNEVSEFPTFKLSDTGITWGGNYGSGNSTGTDCSPTGFVAGTEQDCHQGLDAVVTPNKIGGGNAGFDFTKLGFTGTVLSIQDAAWSSSGSESLGTKWSCVRDNVSGAVWEVKTDDGDIHDRDNIYAHNDWDALVDGSNQENNGMGLCGYNDWRAPTVIELDGVIDLSGVFSNIDSNYFPNTMQRRFWTSLIHVPDVVEAQNPLVALFVNFSDGRHGEASLSMRYRVRLVSSNFTAINSWPDSRYTDHGDGTVTDNATGLMWEKCASGLSGTECDDDDGVPDPVNWKVALERASGSTLANYDDWRVPNQKELRSLVAYDRFPAINQNLFPNPFTDDSINNVRFWSSSPSFDVDGGGHLAWVYFFDDGLGAQAHRIQAQAARVRLVRDIQ